MLERFKNHITNIFPELFSDKIAVAISGGLDSTVLAHLLHRLDIDFSMIHCNFNLRGEESDGDQLFVEELAIQMNCNVILESFDTEKEAALRKCSIQMAARDLRYAAFDKICKNNNIKHVLVAHHQDDQLETFLINLGRGAGLHGLTGIRSRNGFIYRPLLAFKRSEILEFALDNDIKWREDSSNKSTKYLRNQLRHDVIPLLYETLPHLENNFQDTLNYLKDSEKIVEVEVARFRESGTKRVNETLQIDIAQLKQTVQPRIYLYELIKQYNVNLPDALDLLDAEVGKKITAGEMVLVKERDILVLHKNLEEPAVYIEIRNLETEIEINGMLIKFKTIGTKNPLSHLSDNILKNKILLDNDLLKLPLVLRTWQHGDRMQPYGMKGSKLVSDILTDSKISSLEREKVLVLTSGGEIIWLVGKRASKHHQIKSSTKEIIEITIQL